MGISRYPIHWCEFCVTIASHCPIVNHILPKDIFPINNLPVSSTINPLSPEGKPLVRSPPSRYEKAHRVAKAHLSPAEKTELYVQLAQAAAWNPWNPGKDQVEDIWSVLKTPVDWWL